MRILWLVVIIALGLGVRTVALVWGQGYEHSSIGDEIEAYQFARDYAAGVERAQYLGQPNFSHGKVPGPLWALFWLGAMQLGGGPESVMWVMLLLNVAVIPLVYILARKLFGPAYALWAALFYAASPWAAHLSLGCLNFSIMAILGVGLYLALWDVIQQPRSAHIFWVCVTLAVMPQFHMMGAFLVPAVALIIVLSPRPVSKRWLAAGIAVGLALYVPYVRGEMAHHWSNTRSLVGGEMKYTFGVLKIFTLPITVMSDLISSWAGSGIGDYVRFGNAAFGSFYLLVLFNAVSLALAVVYLGGFVCGLARAIRSTGYSPGALFRAEPATAFIGTLLFMPSLLFIFTGHNFASRYLFVQFPILMLLPALCVVDRFLRSPRRRWLMTAVALTIAFDVAVTLTFSQYTGHLIEHGDYFVPSFRNLQKVYGLLRADAGPGVRIRVDADDYPKDAGREPRRGADLISEYVRVRENDFHHGQKLTAKKTYLIVPATSPVGNNERVVFAGNGIKLLALPSAPHGPTSE